MDELITGPSSIQNGSFLRPRLGWADASIFAEIVKEIEAARLQRRLVICCFAELHSAGASKSQGAEHVHATQIYKSAIRQIENPRYILDASALRDSVVEIAKSPSFTPRST